MDYSSAVSVKKDISEIMQSGVCLITVSDGIKDNGCIVNSAVMITSEPLRIVFSLNKRSYTHKLIMKTGELDLSVLENDTDMDFISRFGDSSGREEPKFKDESGFERGKNGILYPTKNASTVLLLETVALTDWDTHTCFTAKVKDV